MDDYLPDFEENQTSKNKGKVTCLGLDFPNDEERREYFTEKLRDKLQDPDFRKIEGFQLVKIKISLLSQILHIILPVQIHG